MSASALPANINCFIRLFYTKSRIAQYSCCNIITLFLRMKIAFQAQNNTSFSTVSLYHSVIYRKLDWSGPKEINHCMLGMQSKVFHHPAKFITMMFPIQEWNGIPLPYVELAIVFGNLK